MLAIFCQVFFGICKFPLLFTAVAMCLLCHKYARCGQHVHVLRFQQLCNIWTPIWCLLLCGSLQEVSTLDVFGVLVQSCANLQ